DVTGNRYLAAAVEVAVRRALGAHPQGAVQIVHGLQQGVQFDVVAAAFNADGALPTGGQAQFRGNAAADALVEAQALEPGRGEDDGVVFTSIEFRQPGVDVAAPEADLQIRAPGHQLGLTAEAG